MTSKEFQPSYTWIQQTCAAYSPKGGCTAWVPIVHTQPERWSLTIADGDRSGSVGVPEVQYERCRVGDDYPACAENPEGEQR